MSTSKPLRVDRSLYPGRTRLPPLVGGVVSQSARCAHCGSYGSVLSPSASRPGMCAPCLELALEAFGDAEPTPPKPQRVRLLGR